MNPAGARSGLQGDAKHSPAVCGTAAVGIASPETHKELDANEIFEVHNLNCIRPLCGHTHSQQN